MSDDVLDKFQKANALAQSGGNRGPMTLNVYAQLSNGENRVRLGGVFVIMNQHFIAELIQPQFIRQKTAQDNKNRFAQSITCLNWDIDNEREVPDELKCCAMCDLRFAARKLERDVKAGNHPEKEKLAKDLASISGKAMPRTKYNWTAIMRADPFVMLRGDDGKEQKVLGWKVLKLPPEANKGVEMLYKQYPKLLTVNEGADITILKNKAQRTTYTVTFALEGTGIAVTPLTAEEQAMEQLDLKRYIMNHPSPRQLFVALPEHLQEIITKVTGKRAEDYPEEPPIKRENKKTSVLKQETTDISEDYAEEQPPAPVQPPKAPAKSPAPKAPSKPAPTPPAPPKPPAPPPPPKPTPSAVQAAKEDVPMPACFGTCDRNDPQCAECQVIDACEAKKK